MAVEESVMYCVKLYKRHPKLKLETASILNFKHKHVLGKLNFL